MTAFDEHVDFSAAPQAQRQRDRQHASDTDRAKQAGSRGAAARFRLIHGGLTEFMLAEFKRGGDVDTVAAGYGPNIVNAIVSLAMNTGAPQLYAIGFCQYLQERVCARLVELTEYDVGSFVSLAEDGILRDYDVRDNLK